MSLGIEGRRALGIAQIRIEHHVAQVRAKPGCLVLEHDHALGIDGDATGRRRSERRFRALVENSSDIVLVVNADRQITFASPAAHRLLGLSEKALLGSHPARWVPAADRPALVLLDISLPGMDGTAVLAALRADPELKDLPVIALTAHAMAGDREKYLGLGFDGYLTKPIVDERVLIDGIAQLLRSS